MIEDKRIRKFLISSIVMLSALVVNAPLVFPQSQARFQDTIAAKAFQAKEYERALEEFTRLREANPNNTLILRYLAITLDQLGRYDEAIDIFKEALAIAPNMPSLYYHLGVTYYTTKRAGEAIESFRQAIVLGEGSKYAEMSSLYLDAISQQLAQQQKPGKPQQFGIFIQGGYQNDNNILALPDGTAGANSDDRYTGFATLDYYLYQSPTWLVTASLNGYGSWYGDNTLDFLEMNQYSGGLRFQKTGTMGRYPYVGSLNYNYQEVKLGDQEPYSNSHFVTLGLRINLTGNTATNGYYRYTNDDFSQEGFDPVFSSRDADNNAVGVSQTWFYAQRRGQVSVGFDLERNNAVGANFEMDGWRGNLGAIIPLPSDFRLDLNASYGEDNYDKFTGPVLRKTERTTASVGLSRWIRNNFQLRLDYSFYEEASTYKELSFDRNTWGVALNYVY